VLALKGWYNARSRHVSFRFSLFVWIVTSLGISSWDTVVGPASSACIFCLDVQEIGPTKFGRTPSININWGGASSVEVI
jgi:hypothetical protein